MTRKKFTIKADVSDEIIENVIPTPETQNSLYDELLAPSENKEKKLEQREPSFKSFHSSTSENLVLKKHKKNKLSNEKTSTNTSLHIAYGSYMLLKSKLNSNQAELSISQIAKYTGLSKASIKKHKETWIKEGWVTIIKEHNCSNQTPSTYRLMQ